MQVDSQLCFVEPGAAPASLVAAAGALVPIGGVLDLLGVGVGVAPPGVIGNPFNGFYGVDPGPGEHKPTLSARIGTALASATNTAAFEFVLQVASDTGAGGGYQPGAWEDWVTAGLQAVGAYPASSKIRIDLAPAPNSTPSPRFIRFVMRPLAGDDLTAGTVSFAGFVMADDDLTNVIQAPSNYVVA